MSQLMQIFLKNEKKNSDTHDHKVDIFIGIN